MNEVFFIDKICIYDKIQIIYYMYIFYDVEENIFNMEEKKNYFMCSGIIGIYVEFLILY